VEGVGESAVELLEELVRIDSVNPGLVPGAAGESQIVAYLQQRLSSAGFALKSSPLPTPTTGRVCSPMPQGPTIGLAVVLNGHVDTVGVEGMAAPFDPRIEGNKLFGRGAADMKGGVAGIVAAAEAVVASGARVRPVLALVADEEDASIGSAPLSTLFTPTDSCPRFA